MLILFSVSSCSYRTDIPNQKIISNLEVFSVKENWESAEKISKNWDQESYLDKIRIDVSLPNGNRGISDDLTFEFQTPRNDYTSIDVKCNNFQCVKKVFSNQQEYPLKQSKPLIWKDNHLDSKDILLISLDYFDSRVLFRDNSTLTLILNQFSNFGENPVWRVLYYDHTNNEEIDLFFDPVTGELLSKKITRP